MGNIDKRSLWLFGGKSEILKDKQQLINSYLGYMFNKTVKMFEYEDLPDTIPAREIELLLQVCKFFIATEVDGKYYIFFGGLGGQPNEYYQPTQAIVTSPYLKYSEVLDIADKTKDGNALVCWNDSLHMGLYPLNLRYASLLTETDLTLKYHLVNLRFNNVFTADDDATKTSLEKMYEDVENGTGYGIIVTKQFMDETNINKVDTKQNSNAPLKDIIETKQYLIGSWLNEIGLNANFNMKRESLNESETSINEFALIPQIDDMLDIRVKFWNEFNKKFGTNVKVKLSSAWKLQREKIEQEKDVVNDDSEHENENEN